jgi:sensor histidine kinase YesM
MRKWAVIGALWTGFAVFFTTQSYTYRISVGQKVNLLQLLPRELLFVASWTALTPLILFLSRRFRVERANWHRRLPLHLLFAVVLAAAQRGVNDAILLSARGAFSPRTLLQSVLAYFDYGVFLYLIVLLISHAVEFYGRYREEQLRASRLRADLAAAQLETLQLQLQPHFLFNTLNSISTLVASDPPGARRMIARLSDFLRLTLENRDVPKVSLRSELALLSSYLEIEKVRFGERLVFDERIEASSERAAVPILLLQPLVENAIHHGVARATGAGVIEIEGRREADELLLRIANRSEGVPSAENGKGFGLGLGNTRDRLEHLYGPRQRIDLSQDGAGGFSVEIRIPFETLES